MVARSTERIRANLDFVFNYDDTHLRYLDEASRPLRITEAVTADDRTTVDADLTAEFAGMIDADQWEQFDVIADLDIIADDDMGINPRAFAYLHTLADIGEGSDTGFLAQFGGGINDRSGVDALVQLPDRSEGSQHLGKGNTRRLAQDCRAVKGRVSKFGRDYHCRSFAFCKSGQIAKLIKKGDIAFFGFGQAASAGYGDVFTNNLATDQICDF